MTEPFLLQEVFDRTVVHLREQGGPALSTTNTCMYRTANGRKCAVGMWIPRGNYDRRLEGKSLNANEVFRALPLELTLGKDTLGMLGLLQSAHDTAVCTQGLVFEERVWSSVWESDYGIAAKLQLITTKFNLSNEVLMQEFTNDRQV